MAGLARGGLSWILPAALMALGLVLAGWALALPLLAGVALAPAAIALFLTWFFRDPDRAVAPDVCSPADGKVIRIGPHKDADVGESERICIFMSPLDVHVNRFPLSGRIRSVLHHPGGFVPAFNKDADSNERVETLLETERGLVKIVQIAGAVARRIVPYVETGQATKGERMGLIRLGSRCDVIAPLGVFSWDVRVGDRVKAGSTRLAHPKTAQRGGGR